MRRTLREGDGVTVTLGGVTHEFPADRVRISVDESTDRGNTARYRFATIVVDLSGGEFPEDISEHLTRMGGTG